MELRPVSQAVEDYVKAIYLLEQSEGKVTTKALALALDVAPPLGHRHDQAATCHASGPVHAVSGRGADSGRETNGS